MFPDRYFSPRFYPDRYFPEGGTAALGGATWAAGLMRARLLAMMREEALNRIEYEERSNALEQLLAAKAEERWASFLEAKERALQMARDVILISEM